MVTSYRFAVICTLCLIPAITGCGPRRGAAKENPRAASIQDELKARWGQAYEELPVRTLVLISPHNENIQAEYEWAFNAYHALEYGQTVNFEWRDVGGGASAIYTYLRNVYSRSQTSGIDVLWGGGEQNFKQLAEHGLLTPLDLPAETMAAIPATFGGIEMYDEKLLWCGSAVSGFGFLYNKQLLERRGLAPPRRWADLGRPEFFNLVALADPTQSGSAAAAYEMIVQSAESWPAGWGELLRILGNAKRFYDSAGDAANAPALGEALVATSIDFYGALRVAQAPDTLVYVSPRGETAFTPDPIGILQYPPNPEVAQRFVQFVLSRQGQALWAVRPGRGGGPVRYGLGRQPIRRDVYELHRGSLLPWIADPYRQGAEMMLDMDTKAARDVVLKHLVRAAAIDNRAGLESARRKLIELPHDSALHNEFEALPDNVRTREDMFRLAGDLQDPTRRERIATEWQAFFRDKYARIAR